MGRQDKIFRAAVKIVGGAYGLYGILTLIAFAIALTGFSLFGFRSMIQAMNRAQIPILILAVGFVLIPLKVAGCFVISWSFLRLKRLGRYLCIVFNLFIGLMFIRSFIWPARLSPSQASSLREAISASFGKAQDDETINAVMASFNDELDVIGLAIRLSVLTGVSTFCLLRDVRELMKN